MANSNQTTPKFWERFRYAYLFFFIVSAVMLRCSKIFQTKSGMANPQFGFKAYDRESFRVLADYCNSGFTSFKCFFIADMFFMLSICWVVYTIYKKIKPNESVLGSWMLKFITVLIILAGISIVTDVLENITYLTGYLWFPFIEKLKVTAISLFLFVFLVYVLINFKKTTYSQMWKFVKSSYISLGILALIGFGLTLLPQGATLIVHLFQSHSATGLISIMCSVFFINLLAIMISHYPKYIEFRQSADKSKVDWHMTEQWKGMGIITYQMKTSDVKSLVLGRYLLGLLAYMAWFYVIYKAFALYGLSWFDPFPATILCGSGYLFFAGHFFFKLTRDRSAFYDKLKKGKIGENDLESIRKWVRYYILWLIFTIIFGFAGLSIYYFVGWHISAYIFSLLFIFCNANCFLLFRFTRGLLTYSRGNLDHILWVNRKDFKPNDTLNRILNAFHIKRDWSFFITGKLWSFLVDFSSNYIFLRRLQAAGFFALFLLLVSNLLLVFGDVSLFSSIPILLAFLVNVYAIIILYVKHMIFYEDYQGSNYYLHRRIKESPGIDMKGIQISSINKNRFIALITLIPIILFGLMTGLKGVKNFHRMDFTAAKESTDLYDYCEHLESHMKTKGIKRMAKVASFGGGLKSNLWNLLVLNRLEKEVQQQGLPNAFLDHCFSLSGVSGGAVALGNYLALDYTATKHGLNKWDVIDAIGNENILSIDMAGVIIHDPLLNSLKLFGKGRNRDRSFYAMEQYIKIITDENEESWNLFSDSSQQYVWHKMFESRGHIPALIINTASTGPFPGVAFSLNTLDEVVFPGYIVLANGNNDLRYYDAVSTSNRFPIMSPAAQVDEKGHFLDGGYFENSGLLTSSYFQKYVRNSSPLFDKTPVVTINVINSKSDYIRKFLDGLLDENYKINSSTNVSAIISGITDINKLPNVLRQAEGTYVEGEDVFKSIYLPHLISTQDIENLYGGTIKFTPKVLDAIQKNNNDIGNAIVAYAKENNFSVSKRGIVEPPLARTLSKYAVIYQQAMITHFAGTQKEIEDIVNWLGE